MRIRSLLVVLVATTGSLSCAKSSRFGILVALSTHRFGRANSAEGVGASPGAGLADESLTSKALDARGCALHQQRLASRSYTRPRTLAMTTTCGLPARRPQSDVFTTHALTRMKLSLDVRQYMCRCDAA